MYAAFYRYVLFPAYEGFLRGRRTPHYLQLAEKNQWRSLEEIRGGQWDEAKRLLAYASVHVPFYRRWFSQRGLRLEQFLSFADFSRLPIVGRDDINREPQAMRADPLRGKSLSKSTGGSTGQPLALDYTRESYEWRRAMTLRGYGWAGYHEGERAAFLWGASLLGQGTRRTDLKTRLHRSLLRQKYFNVFDLSPATMRRYVDEMRRFRPRHLVGYARQVFYFADFIEAERLVPPRLESVLLGAEKTTNEEKERIRTVFDCEVYDTYGSREFMLIGSECREHRGLHESSENLYVEIVRGDRPALPGEVGEVVVTDLHNYAMPFIRYRIGDLARRSTRACPCGRGLPLIEDVEGRLTDVIVTPSGKVLTGLFFPHLMKEFRAVERYQVVQPESARLLVRLVAPTGDEQALRAAIERQVRHVVGEGMAIDFEFTREIALGPSGKFYTTRSLLPPEEIRRALRA